MSATLDAGSNMSQRNDSAIRTGSATITRLPIGKGSKSIIPRGSSPAAVAHQTTCQRSSPDDTIEDHADSKTERSTMHSEASVQSSPGDQTPRNRVSALPTMMASRRSITKTIVHPNAGTTRSKAAVVNSTLQKRQLEGHFATKRHKYIMLRKELAEKQKQALDLYEELAETRERVIAAGFKDPGKLEKLVTVHGRSDGRDRRESGAICEGAAGEQLAHFTTTSVVDGDFIEKLEGKLNGIPNVYLEVCREALTKRTEIISWIAEFSEKNPTIFDSEIIEQLEIHQKDNKGLQTRLEIVADKQQAVINELFQTTSALWGEHENYRSHIKELETSEEGVVRDLREKLSTAIEDLDAEQEKVTQLKDQKSATDAQLQRARTKVRDLENHVSTNEVKIQQLLGTIKNLETQVKQKEAVIEARTKDMQKSMKNSESLVAKTEKQRDSLESRVTELKKKIDSKEAEFNERIKSLVQELEDTKNQLANEKDLKCQAEEKVKELSERCSKLEEKSQQLCDLAETAKDLVAKPTDGIHTENEIRLFNELQSTRSALAEKEKNLLEVQREKEKIVSMIQEAADRKSPESVKDKLTAELVAKTEELQAAITERDQLRKSLKTALEKSENFERQLCDLQNRLHAQSKEGGKTGWGAHTVELQQQLCDLRTTLKEMTRHNEELETALTQKQLEVEQRDRIMREQHKVLKVRDELIGLLKGHSDPNANGEITGLQNGAVNHQTQLDPETIGRLVNKQIAAKAEDLESLYSTLESKQLQLMRLENLVRQMEDDNDRSQAMRTKLEREVAKLRLQLHEKNRDNRYVGVKPGGLGLQRPETSARISTGDSQSLSKFPGGELPKLPALVPIRSRHSSANSACPNRERIPNASPSRINTPSNQKLNDIIRAVEIERARGGSPVSRRVSRSLQRSGTLKNSTQLREDLYDWLMHPAGVYDADVDDSKREFVRHSRALFNGELLTRTMPSGNEFRGDKWREDNRSKNIFNVKACEGSREFRRKYDMDDASLMISPDSSTRTKSKRVMK